MTTRWKLEGKRLDKRLVIEGPGDLRLFVDNDDVHTPTVLREARALVRLLNAAWPQGASAATKRRR